MDNAKRQEVVDHLMNKHQIKIDPDDDILLTLLCLIMDQVAPGAKRDADAILAEQIEGLVTRLNERGREDLGELAGHKTEQAAELKKVVRAEGANTRELIDNLTKQVEQIKKQTRRATIQKLAAPEKSNIFLYSTIGCSLIITFLLVVLIYTN